MFTLNNYKDGEERGAWLPDSEYWVIGKEVGTEGTPHLQGYVVFLDRYRLTQIQKHDPVCKRCHWEPQSAHSTPLQASDYCKKDGNFLEHGEWYLFVREIDDPNLQSSSEESGSDSSSSSYEREELEMDDIAPLERTKSRAITPPHKHAAQLPDRA